MDDFLKEEDIIEALYPPSDISEDIDDIDLDPDFFLSSDDELDDKRRRGNNLPVCKKSDKSNALFAELHPEEDEQLDNQVGQPSTSGECSNINNVHQKNNKKSVLKPKKSQGKNKSGKKIDTQSKPKKKNLKPKIPWTYSSLRPKSFNFDTTKENLPEDVLNLDTPYSFFRYFFDDNLIKKIVNESMLYMRQTDPNTTKIITELDVKKYIGICIIMSVVRLPNVRSYWKESIGNPIIREAMSVNKFEFIRRFIHFNDNFRALPRGEPGHDRLHKIRPLVDNLRSKFKSIPLEEKLCVDEQLCATKARHYMKQYLPMKPHKWGYKLYVLSGISGFAYDFEIYTGQENDEIFRLPGEPDLGSCANIVVRLARCIPPNDHQLYFDNFYTTISLIVYLEKNKIHSLGTVRRDRLPDIELPTIDELKENGRGFSRENCAKIDNVDISCVAWNDNKCVLLLSTFSGVGKQTHVQRYIKKDKTVQNISCPQVVTTYNEHMGGVDKINSIIGRYKIRMRSKKWYMRLFYHLIDVTMCNSWLLYVRACKSKNVPAKIHLADFREDVGLTLCMLGGKTTPKRGRPSTEMDLALNTKKKKPNVSLIPPKEVRTDETGHWPLWGDARLRCKLPDCTGRSYVSCEKCKLSFCLKKDKNCFKQFHTL